MKKYWTYYLVIFSIYEAFYLLSVYTSPEYSFHLKYILHIFLWVGFIGFVFSRRILWQIFWKILLILTCLNYIYFWLVVPIGVSIVHGTSYILIVKYLAWEFHLIPLFYTTYRYAWKSEFIWPSLNKSLKKDAL